MIQPILRYGSEILHRSASPIGKITPDIDKLIQDMVATMYAAPGIGLAATQIGVGKRIFVTDLSMGKTDGELIVFIDPEIIDHEGIQLEKEGCLSVPGLEAAVPRPARIVVRGRDRTGQSQTIEGTGLLARCFQHEMDHLDGILFVNRLHGLHKNMILNRIRKLSRKDKW